MSILFLLSFNIYMSFSTFFDLISSSFASLIQVTIYVQVLTGANAFMGRVDGGGRSKRLSFNPPSHPHPYPPPSNRTQTDKRERQIQIQIQIQFETQHLVTQNCRLDYNAKLNENKIFPEFSNSPTLRSVIKLEKQKVD